MQKVVLLFLISTVLFAFEVKIVDKNPIRGKSTLLLFPKEKGIIYQDIVFEKQKFFIFRDPNNVDRFYGLVPFSYYEKQGKKVLVVHYLQEKKAKQKTFFVTVLSGKYEQEMIHVSSEKVNPKSPEVKKRIAYEYKEAMQIYHRVTPRSYLHKPFILPLKSSITSAFGKARIYNGSLKGYHSGTDFRAKVPTPIVASNDGRVVLVKRRFYAGGTVVIDHGEGIYTCYFHMSHFSVKEGEFIKRGQKIGLSGKSGRVTGPHLHFAARVDGVQVDPLDLIELLNNNLLKEDKQ